MKAWEGRFSGATEPLMERFSSSIQVDWRLFPYDIEGSIAYAEMLARIGILTKDEAIRIADALREIEGEIEQGKLPFRDDLEDIHMHIEHRLIEKIGDLGKKLHTGRSRNEQVSLDTRMYVKEALSRIDALLKELLAGASSRGPMRNGRRSCRGTPTPGGRRSCPSPITCSPITICSRETGRGWREGRPEPMRCRSAAEPSQVPPSPSTGNSCGSGSGLRRSRKTAWTPPRSVTSCSTRSTPSP